MTDIYKCKSCSFGPCFCGSKYKPEPDMFGQTEGNEPYLCPYGMEDAEWKFLAPEVRLTEPSWLDSLQEWMSVEGYDAAPEIIQDVVLGFSLIPSGISMSEIENAYGILRQISDHYTSFFDREELEKRLKRIPRNVMICAVFIEAFKGGVAFAEQVRQKGAPDAR